MAIARTRRLLRAAIALACVGTLTPISVTHPAAADLLVPKSGPKVRGVLVSKTDTEIVFNPYGSRNPAMTWGVLRLTPEQVKRVDVAPPPGPEVFRRLEARAAGDAAELRAIAEFATTHKLKAHAEMAWALLLAEVPDDAPALAAIGGAARFAAMRKGNPKLDPELLAGLRRYAAEAAPAERKKLAAELTTRGFAGRPEELERHRRSALQPKGYQEDVPLALHAERYADAVYTLFVPDAYDPATPWPLLIGLHGGGPDGKAGDEVVGSGPSAMNFYRTLAAERGVLVACPTAQMAGWGNPVNESLVRDVIAEVKLLYHVDVDRIHLTGHSMGGYGSWALGPRMADLFATVAPMAGAGNGNVKPLIDTRTPIFIYHSADDFIPVQPDRDAANRLRESDLDFVYTELDREGHGYPESVRIELFDFLLPRRNYDPKAKDTWPRSSFVGKPTAEEKTYLGDPLSELEGKVPALEEHLACLRLCGGRARTAVTALAASKPAGAVEGAIKIVRDEKASPYARAEAARLLGLLADATGAPALRRAVAGEAQRDTSRLAVAAARALVALGDTGAADALASATRTWAAWFEGKRAGDSMRFSDWERGLRTLSALVTAWAELGGAHAPEVLDKLLVARVFAAGPKVETSDRVPQDPSVARTELARAVAKCYAAAKAPATAWDALLASLESDPTAKAAAAEEKR